MISIQRDPYGQIENQLFSFLQQKTNKPQLVNFFYLVPNYTIILNDHTMHVRRWWIYYIVPCIFNIVKGRSVPFVVNDDP